VPNGGGSARGEAQPRERRWLAYLPTCVALGYGIGLSIFPLAVEPLTADSASYLELSPRRTTGYPLFLALLRQLSDGLHVVQLAQVWLFSASLALLGHALVRCLHSPQRATLALLAIAANPFLAKYHFQILTESVFSSLGVAIVALLALCLESPRTARLCALGAAIAAAIAVRPVGWAFVPTPPLLLLLGWRRFGGARLRTLVAPLGVIAALGAVEMGAARALHGDARTSVGPVTFFAKSALIRVPEPAPFSAGHPYRPVWDAVEALAPLRKLIAEAPALGGRIYLLEHYEVALQHFWALPLLEEAARAGGESLDAVRSVIAWARMRRAPAESLWLAAVEWWGLWTPYSAFHPWNAPRINAYLESRQPLPVLSQGAPGPLHARNAALVTVPVMLAALAGTLATMMWGGVRLARGVSLEPAAALALLCALAVHGHLLLVAFTGIGIPRYALATWPMLMVWAIATSALLKRKPRTADLDARIPPN